MHFRRVGIAREVTKQSLSGLPVRPWRYLTRLPGFVQPRASQHEPTIRLDALSHLSLQARMSQGLPSLSNLSTNATARSLWSSSDCLLGAGAVIIQPSTDRVCIIEDLPKHAGQYFLPRGRKDTGESLEQAALREALEESSYHATFLPALHAHLQPRSPEQRVALKTPAGRMSTEAFYIMQTPYAHPRREPAGYEHIVFWYLCQIPEDAQPEVGTRMPDEQGFVTHLLPFNEALDKMRDGGDGFQHLVLERGIQIWKETQKKLAEAAV
ncbi:hypothetical protein BKA62DRAFT_657138 [Auriculariales sp. MPI-PUGE-AT-0066]|nr:hypothetical protein BKA62DRAFT_657138 [Auriculariales sp. MPI-PUGE-AT-0066]